MIIIRKYGKPGLLDLLRAYYNGNVFSLRLFKNDVTPTRDDDETLFEEADFTGYSAQTLGAFGASVLNGDGHGEMEAALQTFTQSGTGTTCSVYGYYITDSMGGLSYSDRKAGDPVVMDAVGKTYSVVPKYKLKHMD